MIRIEENVSLKQLNTFGIDAKARYFTDVTTVEMLQELVNHSIYRSNKHLILGGGSNVLFTKDFDGLVIRVSIKGIELMSEDDNFVSVHTTSKKN